MDFIISLFFIPVLSGYLILIYLPHFRHTHNSLSGTNLVFYSLLIGIWLKITIIILEITCSALLDIANISLDLPFSDFVYEGSNNDFIVTTEDFLTALLAISYVLIFTRLNKRADFREWLESFEYTFQGGLREKMVEDSMKNWRFVMITLKSRKVYIGVIRDRPNLPSEHGYYIRLIPVVSGYRTPSSLHFKKDNEYGLPLLIMEQLQYMDEGDVITVEVKNAEEIVEEHEVSYEDAKQIDEEFGLLLNSNDIETMAYWIPKLYEWQNP
jgi:hypothetical protein